MEKVKSISSKVLAKSSAIATVVGGYLFILCNPVQAEEGTADWLPTYIKDILQNFGFLGGTGNPIDETKERVKWGLTVLFVAVFLVAIVYSALAAIKFISSQGDASKLEESKGAVKAILMGFAAMIVAIIGIFIVVWVLGGGTTVNPDIPDTTW